MPEPKWSIALVAHGDDDERLGVEHLAVEQRKEWTLTFERNDEPFLVFQGSSFTIFGDTATLLDFGRFLETGLPLTAEELMLLGEGLGEIATSPMSSEDDAKKCEALAGRLATKLVQIVTADPG